jgi:hypothetical protein
VRFLRNHSKLLLKDNTGFEKTIIIGLSNWNIYKIQWKFVKLNINIKDQWYELAENNCFFKVNLDDDIICVRRVF